ncbi:MAG: flagellin [Selenomonadaceae bacterium]|nr:flagellin [Selenomonadaceae bacterium]
MAYTIHGIMARGADGLNTILNRNQSEMAKSIERISTGSKINHAGDDSAGNAISERMKTQIRALDQSQENTQTAGALLGVADAAITSIIDVVTEMHTKAVAAEGTDDEEARAIYNYEINMLKDEVLNQALVTHNGRYLFTGNYGKVQETINDTATYIGEYDDNQSVTDELHFSNMSWKNDDDTDRAMYFQVGPESGNVITAHLMNLTKIFDGLEVDVSTRENATQTIKSLDNVLKRAMYQLTEVASLQERLELTSSNLQMTTDDTRSALSAIEDSDMAKEMTNFVKHNVLMQATQAMMAQANTTLNSFVNLIPTATS